MKSDRKSPYESCIRGSSKERCWNRLRLFTTNPATDNRGKLDSQTAIGIWLGRESPWTNTTSAFPIRCSGVGPFGEGWDTRSTRQNDLKVTWCSIVA